jgi:hypothetical protein
MELNLKVCFLALMQINKTSPLGWYIAYGGQPVPYRSPDLAV